MADEKPFTLLAGDGRTGKVLTLTEARRRFNHDHCQHWDIIVDVQLSNVECADCGASLNPVDVLMRFAREESRLFHRQEEIRPLLEQLKTRSRTKCEHCGLLTKIRFS